MCVCTCMCLLLCQCLRLRWYAFVCCWYTCIYVSTCACAFRVFSPVSWWRVIAEVNSEVERAREEWDALESIQPGELILLVTMGTTALTHCLTSATLAYRHGYQIHSSNPETSQALWLGRPQRGNETEPWHHSLPCLAFRHSWNILDVVDAQMYSQLQSYKRQPVL